MEVAGLSSDDCFHPGAQLVGSNSSRAGRQSRTVSSQDGRAISTRAPQRLYVQCQYSPPTSLTKPKRFALFDSQR